MPEIAQPGQAVKGKPPQTAGVPPLDCPFPAALQNIRRRGIYHHRAHPRRGAFTSGRVALVILFKHLEALIPRQEWYEQGYRANIVTYSLALLHQLIRKQFKNMELDLQSIWQRQSVPESVTKALEQIAEQVFHRITDPNRPTINVTQWCKREGCWNSVQEINLILPAEFSSVLIGKTEVRAAEKEARKDQKVLSETEAQVKVLQYSADQWKKLSAFAMQKRMASPDENMALKYACQIPNKMPSGYQSQRILALLDRALSEGFKL